MWRITEEEVEGYMNGMWNAVKEFLEGVEDMEYEDFTPNDLDEAIEQFLWILKIYRTTL